jgi:succinoglycan biosynthesis transport protein ExoP
VKVEQLESQRTQELSKLEDIQQRIIKIPLVERGFVSIKRDYDTKLEQYNEIIAKTQNAEMAESLEQQQKSERFTLLEAPIEPTAPTEPNRKKMLILAAAFSFGVPAGIVLLLGFFDTSLRNGEALEKLTGSPPLIEIPYINTEDEIQSRRRNILFASTGVAAFVIVSVLLLHYMFMPLGMLMGKIATRFGV